MENMHITIESKSDLNRAVHLLAQREPHFADAAELVGPLPLRRRSEGFESLLGMIVSQQVSVAAADSIWKRLKAAGLTEPESLGCCTDEALRACGLSRQKARYARALAAADLDFVALGELDDTGLVKRLTQVAGVGRWTAEIYGMFSLGRPDMIAAGDLALRESARILFQLPERPTDQVLRRMAESWSPWRAVAAQLLWSYYRVMKNREGVR